MTRFFTAPDGCKLAFRDEGEGMPLLCLAGLTRTMADFDYLLPHLPPVRVIRMDYRGRGQSGWSGAASYTVMQEGKDALDLLDHLGVEKATILGTSRGGLIGMVLAAMAPQRMLGLCLNDVGPEIARPGLERIFDYVGRNPAAKTHAAMAAKMPLYNPGFEGVPDSRWMEEVVKHYTEGPEGLRITYDPSLREAFLAAFEGPPVDLWPLFHAAAKGPLALIRGANSDLLSAECAARMQAAAPAMMFAQVPGRAHIPFLDEPEAVALVRAFTGACA